MQTRQLGPLRFSAIGLGCMGMTPIYAALDVRLDEADLAKLDVAFPPGITAGERYPAGQMRRVGL